MTLTPMMQQYQEAKRQHPGTLLLFRMGDFYELFYDDAETAAKALQLTLTSRDKQVPMAGFPHHSLEHHLHNLLRQGFRVAICDQVEEPSQAQGLVKREVVRVVSAGTLTEDALLEPNRCNHLVAVVPGAEVVGIAWVDISTGSFWAADVPATQLVEELIRLEAAECLWPEQVPTDPLGSLQVALPALAVTLRPRWTFEPATAHQTLRDHFKVQSFRGFGFDDDQPCLSAAGALVGYLRETLKSSLGHLTRLRLHRSGACMRLDAVTRRSLELVRTMHANEREGSLLHSIDTTITAMGGRLLQEWLLAPILDRQHLEARLDAVTEFKEQSSLRRDVRTRLSGARDLARLTARASTGRASPRDVAAIATTLQTLPAIKAAVTSRRSGFLRELEERLDLRADLRKMIESALVDEAPLSPREGGVIRPGWNADLDQLRDIAKGGKEWIAKFQADEITRTGINSLKVGFNRVFGYYIEITHTHATKIPADYQRKQTLKNAERYITSELKTYEDKVLQAEERSMQLEYELFLQLREAVAAQTPALLQTADVLAQLDVLGALAEVAESRNYCRPVLTDEPVLEIEHGRHPVLDGLLAAGVFVPNDAVMGPDAGMILIITGPNMAGKSTYIRQVGLITILAHIGSYVPASRATIGLTDRIFTRVGAGDELARGQSTFMVEMSETANILNNATERSLVVLDEIGRGTSTYDGLALAWAVAEFLHDEIGCRTLFATHYHELTQLAETRPALRNYNVAVREDQGQVVFLHQITAGPANRSYGIHVAQLAGVPGPVVHRAQQVLEQLERQHLEASRQSRGRRRKAADQPDLFAAVTATVEA